MNSVKVSESLMTIVNINLAFFDCIIYGSQISSLNLTLASYLFSFAISSISMGSLSDDVKNQINESMKNVLDDSLIAALNAAVDGVIRRSFQPGDSDQALTDAVKNDLRNAVDGVLNDDLRIQLFHGVLETLQNVSNNNREATSNQQEVKDAVWSAIGLAMNEAVDNAVTESFEHL